MALDWIEVTPQRRAYLAVIKTTEGTKTSPITQNQGYDVIVSGTQGREIFTDYSTHPFARGRPAKLVQPAHDGIKAIWSTASGAYQELVNNWFVYRTKLGLPDFGPTSQDAMALQQLSEAGALPYIDNGQLSTAFRLTMHLWVSLPGGNAPGQPSVAFLFAQQTFINNGGVIA